MSELDYLKDVDFDGNIPAEDPDDLTAEQIAEIRVGIARGLEAAAEGRVKTSAQAVAEARQKHGFPASWASSMDTPKTMH